MLEPVSEIEAVSGVRKGTLSDASPAVQALNLDLLSAAVSSVLSGSSSGF